MIADVIDPDQEEGMLIAAGVSDKLDALKHAYHGLPDFLTRVVEAEMGRIPRHLSDAFKQQLWSIIYMPQVRPHAGTCRHCMRTCLPCMPRRPKGSALQCSDFSDLLCCAQVTL